MKILHLITDLDIGGAEVMLYKLLSHMDRLSLKSSVVSMTGEGALRKNIEGLGIPVFTLGMRFGVPNPLGLWRLLRLLRRERPVLLQTWLYHADLLGILAGKLAHVPVTVWNVRCSDVDMQYYSRLSAFVVRILATMSRFPKAVVVNSEAGRRLHQDLGYRPRRWVFIPNGFDLVRFRPDPEAKVQLRQELSLPKGVILIGLVARFDPMKDHANFFQASHILLEKYPSVHFVLVGRGADYDNAEMVGALHESGSAENYHLLGERKDIPYIVAALDIATSSSCSEGFSNSIGEAMACGVPCVVTDVGDSAFLVEKTGITVPPKAPEALADGWRQLIEMGDAGRRQLGMAARCRIEKNFDLQDIVARYEAFYKEAFSLTREPWPYVPGQR